MPELFFTSIPPDSGTCSVQPTNIDNKTANNGQVYNFIFQIAIATHTTQLTLEKKGRVQTLAVDA